jgi:hypothetical protein
MVEQRIDFKKSLNDAKGELRALQAELGECLAQQEEIERKLLAVRQMIVSFSNVLGEQFEEADELGLTDAVRQAFKTQTAPLEPTAVRTRLQQLGFNTNKYGNFMASVHTVINRLVKSGEIKQQILQPGNKVAYMYLVTAPKFSEEIVQKK